jgi:hypothetical protein
MYQFQQRMKHVKSCIRKWNKEVFGNIQEEKRKLEDGMEEIQKQEILQGYSQELMTKEEKIHQDLNEREKQEEILIHQKY